MAARSGTSKVWLESKSCEGLTRADIKVRETPQHIAKIGGWSVRQVQRMCASGELPAVKISGSWAISGPKFCELMGINNREDD